MAFLPSAFAPMHSVFALVFAVVMALGSMALPSAAEAATPPTLPSPVIDSANILSPDVERHVAQVDEQLEAKHDGAQILVVTVPSLNGKSIEDVSMSYAEKYKPGRAGRDNGVVYLVSENDHEDRLEVGYGLEGTLTDSTAASIIDLAHPYYKSGEWSDGVTRVVDNVSTVIGGGDVETTDSDASAVLGRIGLGLVVVLVLVVLLAVIRHRYRVSRRRGLRNRLEALGILGNPGLDDRKVDKMIDALEHGPHHGRSTGAKPGSDADIVYGARRYYEESVLWLLPVFDRFHIADTIISAFLSSMQTPQRDAYWGDGNAFDVDRFGRDVVAFARRRIESMVAFLQSRGVDSLPHMDDRGLNAAAAEMLNYGRVDRNGDRIDAALLSPTEYGLHDRTIIRGALAVYLRGCAPELASEHGGTHRPDDYRALMKDDRRAATIAADKWDGGRLDSPGDVDAWLDAAVGFMDNRIDLRNDFDAAYDGVEAGDSDASGVREDVRRRLLEDSDKGLIVSIAQTELLDAARSEEASARAAASSSYDSSSFDSGSTSFTGGGGDFGGGGASGSW